MAYLILWEVKQFCEANKEAKKFYYPVKSRYRYHILKQIFNFLGNPGICGSVHQHLILQPILRLAQEFILIFAGGRVQIP